MLFTKYSSIFSFALIFLVATNFGCKRVGFPAASQTKSDGDYSVQTVHGMPMNSGKYSALMASLNSRQSSNDNSQYALTAPTKMSNAFSLAESDTKYMKRCKEANVPMPPPWGDSLWVSKGDLTEDRIFALDSRRKTTLYVYKSSMGTCAALPRRNNSTLDIIALGIICQGTSGYACFWDNVDRKTRAKVSDPDLIKPELLADGDMLDENCSQCHRGNNVFIVHAGTVLEDIPNRQTKDDYVPIGGKNWKNPAGSDTFAPNCQSCHKLPKLSESYCYTVLLPSIFGSKFGSKPTMPPARENRDDYINDINEIEAKCLKDFPRSNNPYVNSLKT